MKDKVLIPAIIITLILLITFMLISIMEQSSYARHAAKVISDFSLSMGEVQTDIENIKTKIAVQEGRISEIQKILLSLK